MPGPEEERQLAVTLLARAEEERRGLLEEARAQGQKILTEAEAQVRALREARIGEARRRAETVLAQRLSEARFRGIEAEARLLESACQGVLEKARGALGELRQSKHYARLLSRLLEECLAEFPQGAPVRLVLDPRDAPALEPRSRFRVEHGGPFLGGVIATDEAQTVVVDNTFEARLRARTSEIRRLLGEVFS